MYNPYDYPRSQFPWGWVTIAIVTFISILLIFTLPSAAQAPKGDMISRIEVLVERTKVVAPDVKVVRLEGEAIEKLRTNMQGTLEDGTAFVYTFVAGDAGFAVEVDKDGNILYYWPVVSKRQVEQFLQTYLGQEVKS